MKRPREHHCGQIKKYGLILSATVCYGLLRSDERRAAQRCMCGAGFGSVRLLSDTRAALTWKTEINESVFIEEDRHTCENKKIQIGNAKKKIYVTKYEN